MHLPAWLKAIIDFLPPRTTPRTTTEEPTMTETVATIDATTGQTIFHTIEDDAQRFVTKVEDDAKAVVADVEAVFVPTTSTAPTSTATTPATTPTDTAIFTKVGDLLTTIGRTPIAYEADTVLAVAAAGPDVDKALTYLKALVARRGTLVDVWDEVVAAAKAG